MNSMVNHTLPRCRVSICIWGLFSERVSALQAYSYIFAQQTAGFGGGPGIMQPARNAIEKVRICSVGPLQINLCPRGRWCTTKIAPASPPTSFVYVRETAVDFVGGRRGAVYFWLGLEPLMCARWQRRRQRLSPRWILRLQRALLQMEPRGGLWQAEAEGGAAAVVAAGHGSLGLSGSRLRTSNWGRRSRAKWWVTVLR